MADSELIRGLRWSSDNAYGTSLDGDEVAEIVAMADELERLRAIVDGRIATPPTGDEG